MTPVPNKKAPGVFHFKMYHYNPNGGVHDRISLFCSVHRFSYAPPDSELTFFSLPEGSRAGILKLKVCENNYLGEIFLCVSIGTELVNSRVSDTLPFQPHLCTKIADQFFSVRRGPDAAVHLFARSPSLHILERPYCERKIPRFPFSISSLVFVFF